MVRITITGVGKPRVPADASLRNRSRRSRRLAPSVPWTSSKGTRASSSTKGSGRSRDRSSHGCPGTKSTERGPSESTPTSSVPWTWSKGTRACRVGRLGSPESTADIIRSVGGHSWFRAPSDGHSCSPTPSAWTTASTARRRAEAAVAGSAPDARALRDESPSARSACGRARRARSASSERASRRVHWR